MVAARAALADAGLAWTDIQFVAGADTIRNGYPGFIAGSTFAQKLGWTGVPISSSYAACACGSQALQSARAQILAGFCDVALVIGADTTPKGFFAPVGGERRDDPDWQRFHLLGATNPVYFALVRPAPDGPVRRDGRRLRPGEGQERRHGLENPNARFRKECTVEDVAQQPGRLRSAPAARHLRHARRCARRWSSPAPTSPGATCSAGRLDGVCRVTRRRHRHADATRSTSSSCPTSPPTRPRSSPRPTAGTRTRSPDAAYEEAGIGPEDLEPRRGLRPVDGARARLVRAHRAVRTRARPRRCCGAGPPRSAAASRSTRPAASPASARRSRPRRSPRCASSRGSCAARPAPARSTGATVGITANQGLFGHGSSVIVSR